jgi:hypothetical protein
MLSCRRILNEAFCQVVSSTLLFSEIGGDSQLPTKSDDIGLQGAEIGVRQFGALQPRHARAWETP